VDTYHDMDELREKEKINVAIATERERCAKLVPTNWLDPLLTGDGVARPPLGERAVEALLRGIQARIRQSVTSTE
jgi:hypothetical protein